MFFLCALTGSSSHQPRGYTHEEYQQADDRSPGERRNLGQLAGVSRPIAVAVFLTRVVEARAVVSCLVGQPVVVAVRVAYIADPIPVGVGLERIGDIGADILEVGDSELPTTTR